jgi:uncharacterized protein (TIGR00251 family)
MKIKVMVKPNASKEDIKIKDGTYIIEVKAPPVEDRANKALIEFLSGYFKKPRSKINILSGHRSRIKLIEIKD